METTIQPARAEALFRPRLAQMASRIAPDGEIRRRFARGSAWVLLGTASSQGLRMAAFVVAARVLGKEGFGELGILHSTVGMTGVFAGLGIGLTATRHVAQYRQAEPERAGNVIGISLVVAVVSGLVFFAALETGAGAICSRLLHAPWLGGELAVAAVLVVWNTLIGAQTGALAGLEAFRAIAVASLLQGVLTFPLVVAGVTWAGLRGALLGLILAAATGCAVQQWMLSRECRREAITIRYRVSRRERHMLASFSLPALLSGAMNMPVQWAAAAILVRQPGGLVEMGAFTAANQWRLLVSYLPGILERSGLPILTSLLAAGEVASYRKTMYAHLLASGGSAAALAVPLIVFAPGIMRLYGAEFEANWPVLALLAAAAVLASANTAIGTAMTSRGAMWLAFLMNCGWATALLACSQLWVRGSGAMGLAGAFLAAYMVHSLWQFGYLLRVRKERTCSAS